MRELFLDCNAHIPLSKRALEAYQRFCNSLPGHGHPMSPNAAGRASAAEYEAARAKIADLLGAPSPGHLVFASSCTEACQWAVDTLRRLSDGRIFISPFEHPAIKLSAQNLNAKEILFKNKELNLDNISSDDSAIIIYLQNEIGTFQRIGDCKAKYLLSDMSQAPGKTPIDLTTFPNVDIGVFGAHKFGGPTSIGILYLKDIKYWTEFGKGSRYYMDRPGTPDVPGVVATAAALEEATQSFVERFENMSRFKKVLEPGLEEMGFEIVAKGLPRSVSTTFVKLGNQKGILALLKLSEQGIYVGLGSACGAANTGPSKIMNKMGYNGNAHDYLRISHFGQYSADDAHYFLDILNKTLKE